MTAAAAKKGAISDEVLRFKIRFGVSVITIVLAFWAYSRFASHESVSAVPCYGQNKERRTPETEASMVPTGPPFARG